jgi:hypothetical protein
VQLRTRVKPRALIDVLFVFVAAMRLIRQLARLYGGRPGTLGMISLLRHVIGPAAWRWATVWCNKCLATASPPNSRNGSAKACSTACSPRGWA